MVEPRFKYYYVPKISQQIEGVFFCEQPDTTNISTFIIFVVENEIVSRLNGICNDFVNLKFLMELST